jgi:ribosomal protein S18 acetylase RimI-like enzyme
VSGKAVVDARLTAAKGPLWRGFVDLYSAVFPRREREPVSLIRDRVADGRYCVSVTGDVSEVSGFCILDRVPDPAYSVITYLGVTEARRGVGLGRALVNHAVDLHRAGAAGRLFVEARDRRALRLYEACGFRALDVPYRAPLFDGSGGTTAMQLLVDPERAGQPELEPLYLRRVIRHIYVDGYHVNPDDERLRDQLRVLGEHVKLARPTC